MMTYENGLTISLCLYLYSMAMTLIRINSQMERNLNKIGLKMSWFDGSIGQMSKSDFNRSAIMAIGKYSLIGFLGIITVPLSWANVFLWLGIFLYKYSKDRGAPMNVKEFRWQLRNQDLSLDELVHILLKNKGLSNNDFYELKKNLLDDLKERRGS